MEVITTILLLLDTEESVPLVAVTEIKAMRDWLGSIELSGYLQVWAVSDHDPTDSKDITADFAGAWLEEAAPADAEDFDEFLRALPMFVQLHAEDHARSVFTAYQGELRRKQRGL